MFCGKCGNEIANNKFCGNCGAPAEGTIITERQIASRQAQQMMPQYGQQQYPASVAYTPVHRFDAPLPRIKQPGQTMINVTGVFMIIFGILDIIGSGTLRVLFRFLSNSINNLPIVQDLAENLLRQLTAGINMRLFAAIFMFVTGIVAVSIAKIPKKYLSGIILSVILLGLQIYKMILAYGIVNYITSNVNSLLEPLAEYYRPIYTYASYLNASVYIGLIGCILPCFLIFGGIKKLRGSRQNDYM